MILTELLAASSGSGNLDVFRAIAEAILAPASSLYEDFWLPTEIVIATRGDHPRGEKDRYGVSGVTRLSAAGAEVRLQIHVPSFQAEALAALPGVLSHELVCHVATRPRAQPDNESTFAEGFMDWAASYFLEAWSSRLPGELGALASEHARRHGAIVMEGSSAAAVARKGGRRAADRLVLGLEQLTGRSRAEACAAVANFAARLNVAEARLARKDSWVDDFSTRPNLALGRRELDCIEGICAADGVL